MYTIMFFKFMDRKDICEHMNIEIINYTDCWMQVKNSALSTVGKENGKYPSSEWKRRILLAEHSPIRLLVMTIKITDIPYYVVGHFVRHKVGVEHFVKSQRTDRTYHKTHW